MLNKLRRKGSEPFIVTTRGEPIAIIYPYKADNKKRELGRQTGKVKFLGDVRSADSYSADSSSDWEALK